MSIKGIPTQKLDTAPFVKSEDTVVGNQDGKTRNFKVSDIRGIKDDKEGEDTTYSSKQINKLISTLTSLSDGDITILVNAIEELNNMVSSNKEAAESAENDIQRMYYEMLLEV